VYIVSLADGFPNVIIIRICNSNVIANHARMENHFRAKRVAYNIFAVDRNVRIIRDEELPEENFRFFPTMALN